MPNSNPYDVTNRGDGYAAEKSQPRNMMHWLSRMPTSLGLVAIGIGAIAAHELTISHLPSSLDRKFVTLAWCGVSFGVIGSGIGFLLKGRFGLMLGAIFGPIILWYVLAAALFLYLEISGEKLFGD